MPNTMIKNIKNIVKTINLEWYIKRGFIYDIYLNIFYKNYVISRQKEVDFYKYILKNETIKIIFDIGASRGDKAQIFSKIADKTICLEPDESCYQFLKKRFKNKSQKIKIVNEAVAESVGQKTFLVVQDGSAYNTLSEEWAREVITTNKVELHSDNQIQKRTIQTTTIDNLISVYGKPDFIKIDVEGYEVNTLMGLSSKIPCITFELNLPQFRDEGMRCIDILNSIEPCASFNFFTDCQKGLELTENINYDQFKLFLSKTDINYLEVICQMN